MLRDTLVRRHGHAAPKFHLRKNRPSHTKGRNKSAQGALRKNRPYHREGRMKGAQGATLTDKIIVLLLLWLVMIFIGGDCYEKTYQ
jgi:hypothetical protein